MRLKTYPTPRLSTFSYQTWNASSIIFAYIRDNNEYVCIHNVYGLQKLKKLCALINYYT